MAESSPHRTITIHPPDEEEIVIEAGIGFQDAPDASLEKATAGDDSDTGTPVKPTVSTKSSDGYEPTTLEDLQSSPVSTTQRVIIVLAVVGLAAFVLWYLASYVWNVL